jgi:trimeric autotransporter adhesin
MPFFEFGQNTLCFKIRKVIPKVLVFACLLLISKVLFSSSVGGIPITENETLISWNPSTNTKDSIQLAKIKIPLVDIINDDGTLHLPDKRSRVVSINGFQMVIRSDGTPYFVKSPPPGGDPDTNWLVFGEPCNDGATDGLIRALATNGSDVFIAGDFTTVDGLRVNRIAKWDGAKWSALGDGFNNSVFAIAVNGIDVYAAGGFTETTGGVKLNRIAKWDGSNWSPLGDGLNGSVNALALTGDSVCVGGSFSLAGNTDVNNIAQWDGSSWSALGSGFNKTVNAIAVTGDTIYAGGRFTETGDGESIRRIAKWDGSGWSALGSGFDKTVNTITVDDGDVYVGGSFDYTGDTFVNRIAKWNGTKWIALGEGLTFPSSLGIEAIAIHGGKIFAGGSFEGRVKMLDSAKWIDLGEGVNYGDVASLVSGGSELYVGGINFLIEDEPQGIAKWNGNNWNALCGDNDRGIHGEYEVYAVATNGNDLYIGGEFNFVGGVPAQNIAKWDGSNWSSLGGGTDSAVYAIAMSGDTLYVGGSFAHAGDSAINNIAIWDGSSWSPLETGTNSDVKAITVNGSDVYVGGQFTDAGMSTANHIAKWDGVAWSALGDGLNDGVNSIAIVDEDIYAGGYFTIAGGQDIKYLAKWDGSNWSAPGDGVNEPVRGLATSSSFLYAVGEFTEAGGGVVNYIAKWDGAIWSPIGVGLSDWATSIAVSGRHVYVGGSFKETADGIEVDDIAKWDGKTWSSLGSGLGANMPFDEEDPVMTISGCNLYVGGAFNQAGQKDSYGIAIWIDSLLCIPECNISGMSIIDVGDCDKISGTYALNLAFQYEAAPMGDTLTIEVDTQSFQMAVSGSGNDTITLYPIADGAVGVDIHAYFADNESCSASFTDAFDAPDECGTSSTSQAEEFGISWYPVPTYDHLIIDFENGNARDWKISILDASGKTQDIIDTGILRDRSQVVLSLKQVPSGIYFIAIGSGNKQITGKIVKL